MLWQTDTRAQRRLLIIGALIVAVLFLISLFMRSGTLALAQIALQGDAGLRALIFEQIRLPRALIALFVGATLGICGAAMQSLLRNPLATPGLVGSSSGAALGAVLLFYLGNGTVSWLAMPLAGTFGSLLAMAFVYALAGRDSSITTLILAGVAVNAVATSMLSLILNLAPSPYAVQEVVLWLLGSVANKSLNDFYLMLVPMTLGWLLLRGCGRSLNALTLGEDTAHTMGVNINRLRWRIFLAISLAIGAAVSTTGMIGFVGLVVPHLLRPLVGYEPARLLPLSALGGAAMLLAADIVVRLFPASVDIKIGVITSIVGAPFFLWLIIRTRRAHL
ncbi:iron ABC transporter permease [Granulosicoccaceae sp. 1_MG-2023]|nr:iron ABC transporter permease [Granulosicoccaceae sp. 1_MG-2023]